MVETFYSALHWAKKAEKSAKLASELSQSTGKVIQLGFDGSFENGELVFKHVPGGVELPYDLYDDTEYEIDLAFPQTGELSNLTKMYIKNGNDKIVFVSAQHRSSTENARVADMEDVMRYNESTGYRWLFKATYKITPSGNKVFLIYPVIAKKDTSTITNCITEIPQDIKLELNNGVLTLKAGSKVYDGNGVFAEITNDISNPTPAVNAQVVAMVANSTLYTAYMGESVAELPVNASTYKIFYNTTDKKCYFDTPSGWIPCSFPIALATGTTTNWTSIDQVFNGFGYIGSTVFALPGVKGLIPNGRNADGTLRNIEFTVQQVLTHTSTISLTYESIPFIIQKGNVIGYNGLYKYDDIDNVIYDGEQIREQFVCGYVKLTNSVISNFTPKLPFHAVDRNDSSWLSGLGMPSGKYIDLTLGAYGTEYIAPANGWFATEGTGAANHSNWIECDVLDGDVRIYSNGRYAQTSNNMRLLTPVAKGKKYVLRYESAVGLILNRFIYAEGEE